MSNVRPNRVLGKKDAEALGISWLTGAGRPRVKFVRSMIKGAGGRLAMLPEDEVKRMVKLLHRLTTDYLIELEADGQSAASKEAHELASRLESAASNIRQVLSRKLVSPYLRSDIERALPHVERAGATLRGEAGRPQRGGGTKFKSDARVELAARLLHEFEANQWRMGTGPKSLMAEALRVCLEVAGTPHANPSRILAAAKELHV